MVSMADSPTRRHVLSPNHILIASSAADTPSTTIYGPQQSPRHDLTGAILEAATYHETEFEDRIFANPPIDLKVLPSKPQSDYFVSVYMETVHPFFQVIEREQFLSQYDAFWTTGVPPEGDTLWQAMLNLILALGCLYARFSGSKLNTDEDVQFFIRARMLSLEPLNLLQIPGRSHVQLTATIAMYLLASNRINRAWLMSGTSIRYASNLGYHLRNIDESISEFDKELNKRIWHSISSLEHLLCFLTGRPLFVREGTTSLALPKAFGEPLARRNSSSLKRSLILQDCVSEQPDRLEAFRRIILLDRILGETLHEFYTASTINKSWAQIQQQIVNLNIKLSTWKAYLPNHYGMMDIETGGQPSNSIEALYLSLRFFSASILINRPSCCYHHQVRAKLMPDQSENSQILDHENAKRAVSSARGIIRILAHRKLQFWLENRPWWCQLHFFVQACALLIMELYDGSERGLAADWEDIIQDARRSLELLRQMRENNPAAAKAFTSLTTLLEVALPHHRDAINRDHQTSMTEGNPSSSSNVTTNTSNDNFNTIRGWPMRSTSAFNTLHGSSMFGSTVIHLPFVDFMPQPNGDQPASP